MKCIICKKEIKIEVDKPTSTVCSGNCTEAYKMINEFEKKYFPTHGCDNCWGDLHQGCTEKCRKEFRQSFEFGQGLWEIIHKIFE